MKLGVFMLWTEMRTPQSGLLPGTEQHAQALSAVGLGEPFAHDDVIPEALRLDTLRSVASNGASKARSESNLAEAHTVEPSRAGVAPTSSTRSGSKLSSSRKLVGADKLAKVVSTVRAKRAASQPAAPTPRARSKSGQVASARSASSKQLAAR